MVPLTCHAKTLYSFEPFNVYHSSVKQDDIRVNSTRYHAHEEEEEEEEDVKVPFGKLYIMTYPASIASLAESTVLSKHQAATRFFHEHLAGEDGLANGWDIARFLKDCGFLAEDPRFTSFYASLYKEDQRFKTGITMEDFVTMVSHSNQAVVLERAFRGELVVPDFPTFTKNLKRIFEETMTDIPVSEGSVASYIPQLGKVDPSLFGMAVCTVDGQQFYIGDAKVDFCMQSCAKPLAYCLAMEELGEVKVHKHVGREPSGVAFNSLCLNNANLPHNPYINAGAIMVCSMIEREKPIAERFEYIVEKFSAMSGGARWGFNNSVFLSEKATADNNFCLAYMMRRWGAFPHGTDLEETLDLYFQCCSMEANCTKLAIAGATIASGGSCPMTGEKLFNRRTCRNCLSLMYSCGMYDYSGEWAFTIGVPAKSGVSGCIFGIIPDLCCFTIYAPPLDAIGNSVRGVEFFKKLVNEFIFHNFDSELLMETENETGKMRLNPRKTQAITDRESKIAALYAAAEGDLTEVRRAIMSGVPPNIADYDGRTLLHLAASEGNLAVVKYLVVHHDVDLYAKDRWGGTPCDDAVRQGHKEVARFLSKHMKPTQFDFIARESPPLMNKTISSLLLTVNASDVQQQKRASSVSLPTTPANGSFVSLLPNGKKSKG